MATFFLILLTNICIATIFYLILSLKIEKKATGYQSQKMKREMDEIIREFNSTAERNISILENRISILKNLLEKSGNYTSLDKKVIDEGIENNKIILEQNISKELKNIDNEKNVLVKNTTSFKKVINKIHNKLEEKIYTLNHKGNNKTHPGKIDYKLDEEISVTYDEIVDDQTSLMDENEIIKMLNQSDNNYEVIGKLYLQGYSIDLLSKCSGIPVGEISLILNLSNNF